MRMQSSDKSSNKRLLSYDELLNKVLNLKNLPSNSVPVFSSWIIGKRSDKGNDSRQNRLYKVDLFSSDDNDVFFYITHLRNSHADTHFHIVRSDDHQIIDYINSVGIENVDLTNEVFKNTPFNINYTYPRHSSIYDKDNEDRIIRFPDHNKQNHNKIKIVDTCELTTDLRKNLYSHDLVAKVEYLKYLVNTQLVTNSKNQISLNENLDGFLNFYLSETINFNKTHDNFQEKEFFGSKTSVLHNKFSEITRKCETYLNKPSIFEDNFYKLFLLDLPHEIKPNNIIEFFDYNDKIPRLELELEYFSKELKKIPNTNTHHVAYKNVISSYSEYILDTMTFIKEVENPVQDKFNHIKSLDLDSPDEIFINSCCQGNYFETEQIGLPEDELLFAK